MWFGRNDGGVARLEGGVWTLFTTSDGLPNNQVYCLLATTDGSAETIWAGTDAGLGRFADGKWSGVDLPGPLEGTRVLCLAQTADRAIWVGTSGGLARLLDGDWTVWTRSDGLPASTIRCIQPTSDEARATIWVGTEGGGIARLGPAGWEIQNTASGLPDNTVYAMLETSEPDGTRTLWVGTYGGGLAWRTNDRWRVYDTGSGLPSNVVKNLVETRAGAGPGTVWIGTEIGGLVRLERGNWLSLDRAMGGHANPAWSFLEVEDDAGQHEVWIGTWTGGLWRHSAGNWESFTAPASLPSNLVSALASTRDRGGTRSVWAGTFGGGLARLKGGRWTRFDTSNGLPHNRVTRLLATDTGDGTDTLWVGTYGGGLARLRNGTWSAFDARSGLPNDRVQALLQVKGLNGNPSLWVGTDRGVAVFADETWESVKASQGLINSQVVCFHQVEDPSGRRQLWAGTMGNGVNVRDLDDVDSQWLPLTNLASKLPSQSIYSIQEDAEGRIYLFTGRGVCQLTRREGGAFTVVTYTMEDGLPSNECSFGASLVDSHGRIWAGTNRGAAVFDPSGAGHDTEQKPLYVEDIRLDGVPIDKSGLRDLAHYQNNLSFQYCLLSYSHESETRYRTQLVGFDARPSDWTAEAKRFYTNLPAGAYRFLVWGRDAHGNVSGPQSVFISIRAAPWLTWWAWLLYVGLIVAAAYAFSRVRLLALQRRTALLEAAIAARTAELAEKVVQLGESEQRANAAREEALEAKNRALRASHAKTTFLANMSHELRTPLNAILGFVQVMQRRPRRDSEDREYLSIISRSGEHLLGLINDVLSIAKIEEGQVTLDVVAFDLHALLRGVEEMFRMRAETRGLQLLVAVSAGAPRYVRGDAGKLRQVLINLLGNAIKFTTDGHVALRVATDSGRLRFEVEDTGPGIAESELENIFDAFVQIESRTGNREGTGLGLTISRRFCQIMGGHLAVSSTPGRGTKFWFVLELPEADPGEVAASPGRVVSLAAGHGPQRILLVDDSSDNRRWLARLLADVGFEVREAASGDQALEIWRQWRPRVICMDMRMPSGDGLSILAALRREEAAGGCDRTVVIGLSALAFEHERAEILTAGCDAFISKPVREELLFDQLAACLGLEYQRESVDEPTPVVELDEEAATNRLARQPMDVLIELEQAALLGSTLSIDRVVARVHDTDPVLAAWLSRLSWEFRFDTMQRLVARTLGQVEQASD
jgi:signal transduction histidine kinase/ligand-binding sensor domain-containing protein/DNA-binding response OmpR family regulator